MQLCYVVQQLGKITNMNFDIICKKTGCLGKMAITFAYDVGSKSFLYEKASTRKVTSEFDSLWLFVIFLESSNSKGKIEFSAILDFGAKIIRKNIPLIFGFLSRTKFLYMMKKMIWMSYLDSSHFSDRFRHIICRIPIYGFVDMNYSILFQFLPEIQIFIIFFGINN